MPHEHFSRIALGVITGVAFGYFLNKGSAANSDTIPDQLSGKNSSVLKIMLTASAVGALGTQILKETGHGEAKVKPLNIGGILAGGALFGTGMAVSGYCPGTSMAALGTGKKDAALTVLGMLSGATAFVRAYPTVKPLIEMGSLGKLTLPELTRTSPWVWIAAMSAATGIIRFDERKRTQCLHSQREWYMPKNRGCEEACDKGKKVPLSKEEKETGEEVAKRKREIITENDST